MPENLASDGQTARLGAEHEVLLTQGQYLPAHKARRPSPAEQRQHCHHDIQLGGTADVLLIQRDTDDHHHGHGRDAVEDIHDTHDDLIHPLAEIAGKSAQEHAQHGLQDNHHEADGQRHATAVHQAGENVKALVIGTQQVGAGGGQIVGRVGVVDDPDLTAVARRALHLGIVCLFDLLALVRLLLPPDKGEKLHKRSCKGKHEQHEQDDESRHGQAGAEEPLHDQPSGTQRPGADLLDGLLRGVSANRRHHIHGSDLSHLRRHIRTLGPVLLVIQIHTAPPYFPSLTRGSTTAYIRSLSRVPMTVRMAMKIL